MDLTTLYVNIDDFMKHFNQEIQPRQLGKTKQCRRTPQMSMSEIITILVYFQYSAMCIVKSPGKKPPDLFSDP